MDKNISIEYTPAQTREMLKDDDTMSCIYADIAVGLSLVEVSEKRDIHYGYLIERINGNETLRKRLADAFQSRKEYTKEKLLMELQALAQFNIADMYDKNAQILSIPEMPTYMQKCIKSCEQTEDIHGNVKTKIVFIDKLKALEVLAKTTDLLTEKIELTVGDKLEDIMNRTFKKGIKNETVDDSNDNDGSDNQ